MKLRTLIEMSQSAMNSYGAGLTVDGSFGPKTEAAAEKFDFILTAKPKAARVAPLMPAKFTEPEFVRVKGVKFKGVKKYATKTGMFEGLVVHYTVSGRSANSAIGVLKFLAGHKDNLGCMVMDEDGKIYTPEDFNIFTDSANHAGTSEWAGRKALNHYYAGMEICCMGLGSRIGPLRVSKGEENIMPGSYQEYTPKQEAALTNFILWAQSKNPAFSIDRVCGHDEARTEAGYKGGKSDPGASLSMTMPKYRAYLRGL